MLGVGCALLFAMSRDKKILVSIAVLALMVGLWCVYALVLTPQMNNLRTQINSFDAPLTTSLPFVQTFRGYHVWYSRLVGANMIAGLILLVWQTRHFLLLAQNLHQNSMKKLSE